MGSPFFFFQVFFLGGRGRHTQKKKLKYMYISLNTSLSKDDLSQFNTSTTWYLMAIRTRRSTGSYRIALMAYNFHLKMSQRTVRTR